ncbi:MAG TPA: LCP family protein [Acidimicrobiia bacterium]|nr:LCP family protein [Acidimicrobiia bacterium]
MPERRPSSFGAALRSTVVPGWGQLAVNRPRIGKTLVFITGLMLIAALTVFLFVEPVEWAAWLIDPDVILFVVVANLLFAVVRLFSTGHAWVVGGGHRWFAAMFLAVIVAIPHAALAWVGLETRDSIMKVFPSSGPVAAAAVSSTTSSTTTTLPTTTTTQMVLITVATGPGRYGDDQIDFENVPLWRPFGDERLNLLLLGGDAGPGRAGLRTDTMIVASIDPVSGDTALIGLPRNFGQVAFTDGTAVPVELLNAVYGWGHQNPKVFGGPDPGAAAIQNVAENITGLDIDHYMLVDLTGFADLVNAFGGVTLDVPTPIDGPLYDTETGRYQMVRIEPGEQVLDGGHALAYARARYGSSDYVRMGRQRCILASMARDADPLGLVSRFPDLLAVIENNMSTDFPIEKLPDLIKLAPRVESDTIRVIGFDSNWGTGRTVDGAIIPDIARIRQTVVQMIDDPSASETLGAATAEAACS